MMSQRNGTQYEAWEQGLMNTIINTLPSYQQHNYQILKTTLSNAVSLILLWTVSNTQLQPNPAQFNQIFQRDITWQWIGNAPQSGRRPTANYICMYVCMYVTSLSRSWRGNTSLSFQADSLHRWQLCFQPPCMKRNDVTMQIQLFQPENEDRYMKGTKERDTNIVDEDTKRYLAEFQGAISTNKNTVYNSTNYCTILILLITYNYVSFAATCFDVNT